MSEVSYSENGKPATVQRKTMQYSTDPSDFTSEIDADYKTSTSERKSSRGGVYSVTKLEKFHDDGKSSIKSTSSPSSKVIRRGSVKELKEKFVRKDSSSRVTESSTKRSSVDYRDSDSESESYSVSKQYRTASKDSKSFLNSEKKASNVQEVLSYMKNADHGEIELEIGFWIFLTEDILIQSMKTATARTTLKLARFSTSFSVQPRS